MVSPHDDGTFSVNHDPFIFHRSCPNVLQSLGKYVEFLLTMPEETVKDFLADKDEIKYDRRIEDSSGKPLTEQLGLAKAECLNDQSFFHYAITVLCPL